MEFLGKNKITVLKVGSYLTMVCFPGDDPLSALETGANYYLVNNETNKIEAWTISYLQCVEYFYMLENAFAGKELPDVKEAPDGSTLN